MQSSFSCLKVLYPDGFVERQPVSDHKRRIYLPVLNDFQKGTKILVNVRLTHLESETL